VLDDAASGERERVRSWRIKQATKLARLVDGCDFGPTTTMRVLAEAALRGKPPKKGGKR
jgi:hypothetical protein